MVLGGVPFPEPVFMWWNFVARNADEVSTFYADWRDRGQRFGEVDSTLVRIPAPPPPWEPIRTTDPTDRRSRRPAAWTAGADGGVRCGAARPPRPNLTSRYPLGYS